LIRRSEVIINEAHEFAKLVESSKPTIKSTQEELELINIGIEENEKQLKIKTFISKNKSSKISLLKKHSDVFS